MNFPTEGLQHRNGTRRDRGGAGRGCGASAADKAALFKTFVKVWAQRRDMMATFMAQAVQPLSGPVGFKHIHLSLQHQGDGRFRRFTTRARSSV